jgi:hypothetical protein
MYPVMIGLVALPVALPATPVVVIASWHVCIISRLVSCSA